MEEITSQTSITSTDFATSSISRYEGLIDIPLNERLIDALTSLFNYFDIYAPRMSFVYNIVTFFRFLELLGGSFMAANLNSFEPGTFTFKVMSVLTVFFHLIPLQYRRGNGWIILYVVNSLLIIFGIYLIIVAFKYKKSSKVSNFSTIVLSIYLAIGPFLFVPISAQYCGQILSGYISKDVKTDIKSSIAVATSVIAILMWLWIIIKAYSISLVFRQVSFQSIEGAPQTRLLITTTIVTFASALTTNFGSYPSAAMMILSIILYIYCATTVFGCGTFVKKRDQIMALGGSILGILLCAANLYTVFADRPWEPFFFIGVIAVGLIVFVGTYVFINRRMKNDLKLLDEIDDTQDIKVLKNIRKWKQILPTGFMYCHPICVNFKIFKLAIQEWKDNISAWALYAKFIAIYPEENLQLSFIAQNVSQIKTNAKIIQSVLFSSTGYIIKTRETKFTQQLKSKISKLSKMFNKTKRRLRNIWDLTLQGNINEMGIQIRNTKDSVEECEVEMNHLLMQYHNNKYVARQYVMFLNDIKGDPVATKSAIDTLQKLQRGISVAEDTIHELGMIAFPTIPDICVDTEIQKIVEVESQAGLDDTLFDDTENFEAVETIYKHIQNHKIPSIRYIIWSTTLAELFIIIIPLIIMLGVYYEFAVVLEDPVKFMKGIADTRDIICMLTAFTGRYILQGLDDPYDPTKKIEMEIPFRIKLNWDAFAGYSKTIDIMRWIAQTVSDASEVVSPLRNYKIGNTNIEKVRDIMFTKITNYSYYLNNTFKYDILASTTDISYQLATVVGRITDLPEITIDIANGPDSLTARNNCQNALLLLNQALLEMIEFLKKNNKSYQLYFKITIITAIIACAIIYPVIYVSQIKKLRRNRYEVLYVLTTLPKTVVSSISASYTSRKGDETKTMSSSSSTNDIELNKQEESIIKLFSSISDGSSKASIELVIGICILFITVLGCLSYYVSMQSYISASENVVYNCHHINYLFGANSYLYSIMASFFKISMSQYHPSLKPSIVSLEDEINNIKERIPMLVSYFQMIRLGGEDRREIPFSEMSKSIKDASEALTCFNISEPPTRLQDSTHCLSAAQQLYVATMIMKRYYGLMTIPNPYYINPSHENLPQLWQIGPIELYLTFFWQAEESIVPIIVEKIGSEDFEQNFYSAMFIISTALLSMIIIIMAVKEDKLLKFTLKLFLKCPSSSTLGNQRVMDLLIGNYTYRTHDDQSQKSAEFTNDVVNRLNEVIIVCQDETGKVISVNNSFETMFGIKEDEIRDTPVRDFFKSGRFIADGEIEKVITQGQKLIYKKDDADKIYLDWTTSVMSGRRIYSGRDETQNMMHEKLIADEKKKSDQMLASILPPMLVQRVQAGEKNISFSVQSATVLFLDVVEFTPWCGSHDAQYVMRMLNIMFKEFDAITNAHKTMTKIKCIGDCYMAAGGIFDEVNQPAVHAKEVVDFGTLVIKKLLEIDEREKENLRIRVGINTGGPIVAGVIGTEKPTFEILGPAINMAHEMENKGVPMKVHISRPVYELIYGQQFEIKERGEIDVKGGKMFTYLVEP